MLYLWIKALHIIAMVCWFAGLFYLPRLFVYHAMSEDETSCQRFCLMERKLYRGIMLPALIATVGLGLWLLHLNPVWIQAGWMQVKLLLAGLLIAYHFACGAQLKRFASGSNIRNHIYFRWFNEVPVLFLIAIVALVIIKPF